MSQQLINHSADLRQLAIEGYALRIAEGHLVVEEIPYLDASGNIRRGAFVCPLDATAEQTVPPRTHIMSFSGDMPCDRNGRELSALGKTSPCASQLGDMKISHGFSNKLRDASGQRSYKNFHEKVVTYVDIILGEVHAVDQNATPKVGALPSMNSEDDAFVFPDSASARSGTTQLAALFKSEIVALVGLGGTGAYILDHVSKTPIKEARLFDNDRFYPHNAFRSPGAPAREELQPPRPKVDYHAGRYAQMKNGIIPNAVALTAKNVSLLDGVTFAFLAMDPGPSKAAVIAKLDAMGVAFVEVGMGLHMTPNGLGGTLRAVLSTPENRSAVAPHIPVDNPSQDRLYMANIQVSDLNSMNADMAVQLWKAHRGFYADHGDPVWIHQVDARTLIRTAA
tara:strand:+ start:2216 stop:3400 length:1185 start_codon:yes stop_codon:yes gene_type:complete